MDTIAHRELRNSSSEVLGRVAAGESIAVTNHGVVAAVLVPPGTTILARLKQAGVIRSARRSVPGFGQIPRARLGVGSDAVLSDVRGDR